MNTIYFISGLPRSGSTMLAAVLRQNPKFHAGMTSPVFNILQAVRSTISSRSEGSSLVSELQKRDLLFGVFDSYYKSIDKEIIFDTNRAWCAALPLLFSIFSETFLICCVRDISWIMDSFERALSRNPIELSGIWNFDGNMTVYQRVNALASSNGIVGWSLDALREACSGVNRKRLILIEYNDICRNPRRIISKLYNFLGQPLFDHDFGNLSYSATEFDRNIGMPGLHTVSGTIQFEERETILPKDLFMRFSRDSFWREDPAIEILS